MFCFFTWLCTTVQLWAIHINKFKVCDCHSTTCLQSQPWEERGRRIIYVRGQFSMYSKFQLIYIVWPCQAKIILWRVKRLRNAILKKEYIRFIQPSFSHFKAAAIKLLWYWQNEHKQICAREISIHRWVVELGRRPWDRKKMPGNRKYKEGNKMHVIWHQDRATAEDED